MDTALPRSHPSAQVVAMLNKSDTPPSRPSLLQVARTFRLTGWIGFWMQLVLGVIASVIFFFTTVFAQVPNAGGATAGIGGSIIFVIGALLALYYSIYQALQYVRVSRRLRETLPNLRPKKADTLQLLQRGLLVSLGGMLLTILAAQSVTGTLVAKALTTAQAQGAILDRQLLTRTIQPLDIFLVLAITHTITAHFAGIVTSFWLLNRINRQ